MKGRKVKQYTLEGAFVKEWESAAFVEVTSGVSATNVIKCCKGKRDQAGGFKWKYSNEVTSDCISSEYSEETKKINNDKGTLESTIVTSFDPQSDIELAKTHKIDLSKYKISNYWSKLRPDGRFTSSVLASLKKAKDITKEDVLTFLKSYKSDWKPMSADDLFINQVGNKCCAFIDITDFHLDKRELRERTPQQRKDEYLTVLQNLIRRAYSSYNIDEIVFVIGSDMLHTDNFFNSTTKGTPQETTLRWNEAFEMAFDIYAKSIQHLKQFCKTLKVISVLGNHGRVSEFHLAFALSKYFDTDKDIKFDISTSPRKIYTYGSTFIGLHHGNTKILDLPLVFSKEYGKEWGNAKYHEIKVGDQHHYMEKDYKGVLIKQLPALTDTDTWHNDHNYINQVLASICSIYDIEKGRIADIHERP